MIIPWTSLHDHVISQLSQISNLAVKGRLFTESPGKFFLKCLTFPKQFTTFQMDLCNKPSAASVYKTSAPSIKKVDLKFPYFLLSKRYALIHTTSAAILYHHNWCLSFCCIAFHLQQPLGWISLEKNSDCALCCCNIISTVLSRREAKLLCCTDGLTVSTK